MAERRRRQGTGRKKLEMVKMTNTSNRDVTFSKRHHGISKKLYEFSTLTGANAAVIGFTTKNKPFAFGCPSVSYVLDKYQNPGENSITFLRGLNYLDRDWGQEIVSLREQLREEKICGETMDASHKQRQKFWWEVPMEEFTFDQLEKHMIDLLKNLSYISNALKNRQVHSTVNFGSPLQGLVVQDAVSLPTVDFQVAAAVHNVVAAPTKNGFDLLGTDILQGSIALPMKEIVFPLQGANALQTEEFQGSVAVQDVVAPSTNGFRFPLQDANVVRDAAALPTQNFGSPPQVAVSIQDSVPISSSVNGRNFTNGASSSAVAKYNTNNQINIDFNQQGAVAGQGAVPISSSVNGRNFTNSASSSAVAKYNANNQINIDLNPMEIQDFGFPQQGAVTGQGAVPISSSVNERNFTNGASSSAVAKYNANNQINTDLNPMQIQDFGFPQQGAAAGQGAVPISSSVNGRNFTNGASSSAAAKYNANNQINTDLNPMQIQDFGFPQQGAAAGQGAVPISSSVNGRNFTNGASSSTVAKYNANSQINTILNPIQIHDFGFPQEGAVAPPTEDFGFPPVVIPSSLNEGNFTTDPSSSTVGEYNLDNQISTGLNPVEIQNFNFPQQGAVDLPTEDFGFPVEDVFANQGTIDVPSSVNQENFTTGADSSAIAENNVPNEHNQISTDLNPMQIQSTVAGTSFAGSSSINENVQPILDGKSFGDDLVYASLWPTREDELSFAKLMFG